jgi:hypothetical protein
MSWEQVPRSEVLDRAKDARLVIYGEVHRRGGPLREAQMEVLRAFATNPAFEAVGYEPSVEEAQRPVLDLARSLGLRVIPLETNWREPAAGRQRARELEAIAAIEAFFAEGPSRRMLVLRGESHCLPDGFLVRRLSVKPLVLHCGGATKFVPLCVGGLHCIGSTFKLGESGDLYVLPYNDNEEVAEVQALEAWLAAHPELLERQAGQRASSGRPWRCENPDGEGSRRVARFLFAGAGADAFGRGPSPRTPPTPGAARCRAHSP